LNPQDDLTCGHKGYVFLEFESAAVADNVINSMNGFQLAGRCVSQYNECSLDVP
jgi:RNA recognition motif-containing protein